MIIFILFCGIVGIPAPEEMFIILNGAFVAEQNLNFLWSISAALLGANIGGSLPAGITVYFIWCTRLFKQKNYLSEALVHQFANSKDCARLMIRLLLSRNSTIKYSGNF